MSAFDESKIRRGQPSNKGQFASKPNSAPDSGLSAVIPASTAPRPTERDLEASYERLKEAKQERERARLRLVAPFGRDFATPEVEDDVAVVSFHSVDGYEANITHAGVTHYYQGTVYAQADELPRAARKARRIAATVEENRQLGIDLIDTHARLDAAAAEHRDTEKRYIGDHAIWDDPSVQRQVEDGAFSPHDLRMVNDDLERQGRATVANPDMRKLAMSAYDNTSQRMRESARESEREAEAQIGSEIRWEKRGSPSVSVHSPRVDGRRGQLVTSTVGRSGGAVHYVGPADDQQPYTRAVDMPDELASAKEMALRFEQAVPLVLSAWESRRESERLSRRADHFMGF